MLTPEIQADALKIIAAWFGAELGYDGPVPTGVEAYETAQGPLLIPDWDWPDTPTPTIVAEGIIDDWTFEALADDRVQKLMRERGIYAEPYASYALCLYPAA